MAEHLPSLVRLLRLRLHRSFLGPGMEKKVDLEDWRRLIDQYFLETSLDTVRNNTGIK